MRRAWPLFTSYGLHNYGLGGLGGAADQAAREPSPAAHLSTHSASADLVAPTDADIERTEQYILNAAQRPEVAIDLAARGLLQGTDTSTPPDVFRGAAPYPDDAAPKLWEKTAEQQRAELSWRRSEAVKATHTRVPPAVLAAPGHGIGAAAGEQPAVTATTGVEHPASASGGIDASGNVMAGAAHGGNAHGGRGGSNDGDDDDPSRRRADSRTNDGNVSKEDPEEEAEEARVEDDDMGKRAMSPSPASPSPSYCYKRADRENDNAAPSIGDDTFRANLRGVWSSSRAAPGLGNRSSDALCSNAKNRRAFRATAKELLDALTATSTQTQMPQQSDDMTICGDCVASMPAHAQSADSSTSSSSDSHEGPCGSDSEEDKGGGGKGLLKASSKGKSKGCGGTTASASAAAEVGWLHTADGIDPVDANTGARIAGQQAMLLLGESLRPGGKGESIPAKGNNPMDGNSVAVAKARGEHHAMLLLGGGGRYCS